MNKYPRDPLVEVEIGALAWLTGKWFGVVGKSPVEEYWTAPAGGSVMGMFRWLEGDGVRFYEILVIEEEGGGLVMRIKHFDPGLKGWEEKDTAVTYDLVRVDEGEAVFFSRRMDKPQWLIYTLDARHKLVAFFEGPEGPVTHDEKFRFTLVE